MKIIRFIIQHLHNEEWFQFMAEFKKEVEATGGKTLNIEALFATWLVLFGKADELLLLIRKSQFTKAQEDTDKERDHIFSSILKTVEALCHMPDTKVQTAAEALLIVLEHYKKDILAGGYDEESGAITNLLQDLGGKYAAEVGTLNLSVWIAALTDAQNRFLALREERYNESALKPKADLQKIRLRVEHYYVTIINQIDALLLAAGYDSPDSAPAPGIVDPVYNFAVSWNERVKNYKTLLAQRKGRKKAAASEQEEA
ncbi:MAG: DUF6261 family protein [Tannerella sp.]|jgi:hypothetical protein|nr:DUF6261 family protein [Tannerella sp.]